VQIVAWKKLSISVGKRAGTAESDDFAAVRSAQKKFFCVIWRACKICLTKVISLSLILRTANELPQISLNIAH
jgi:hypothetical protein